MRTVFSSVAVLALFMAVGCTTAPRTQAEKQGLVSEAEATVAAMSAKDPSLRNMLDRHSNYAVYPNIGRAGAIVGGAYGRGVVFEDNRPVGFTEVNQASVGAQIGGQSFSQIIVFENEAALNRLKAGNFDVGAEASAVALTAGAADSTSFEGGVAVFQLPRGGLMAAATVNGQKINYEPMSESFSDEASTASGRISTESSESHDDDHDSGELRLRTERIEDRN